MVNPNINGRKIICDEQLLDEYLSKQPLVLLIDELNILADPINAVGDKMLKRLFPNLNPNPNRKVDILSLLLTSLCLKIHGHLIIFPQQALMVAYHFHSISVSNLMNFNR